MSLTSEQLRSTTFSLNNFLKLTFDIESNQNISVAPYILVHLSIVEPHTSQFKELSRLNFLGREFIRYRAVETLFDLNATLSSSDLEIEVKKAISSEVLSSYISSIKPPLETLQPVKSPKSSVINTYICCSLVGFVLDFYGFEKAGYITESIIAEYLSLKADIILNPKLDVINWSLKNLGKVPLFIKEFDTKGDHTTIRTSIKFGDDIIAVGEGNTKEESEIDASIEFLNTFEVFTTPKSAVTESVKIDLSNPKSNLQEYLILHGFPTPNYHTKRVGGPDHQPVFEAGLTVSSILLATARAHNKQEATEACAIDLINKVNLNQIDLVALLSEEEEY